MTTSTRLPNVRREGDPQRPPTDATRCLSRHDPFQGELGMLALQTLQHVRALEESETGAVGATKDVGLPGSCKGGLPFLVGQSRDLVLRRRQANRHAELFGETMLRDLELHWAHGRQERLHVPAIGITQDLDDSLFFELDEALAELLVTGRVDVRHRHEMFRCEAGQPGELDPLAQVQRVADPQITRVHQTDDVSWISHVDRLTIAPEQLMRVVESERPTTAGVRHDHPSFEHARADADERDPIAMARVHVRLDLEDETREGLAQVPDRAVLVLTT